MNTKFRKITALCLTGLMAVSVLSGCGAPKTAPKADESQKATAPAAKVEVVVAAAASLTDVTKELSALYAKKAPNVTLTFTYGASGALQTQIEEGAPADIFISAAQKQMKALAEKDLIVADSRKDLLVNKVVLIAPKDSKLKLAGFEDVAGDKVQKIALGEPKGVPVGQYSEEIFTTLKNLDAVKAKAVYGSDVRQVLTWVESGEVDCGVVYATDAATSDKITVICEAPEGSHKPVVYPVAVMKGSKQAEAAQSFVDFLSTAEAKAVFEKAGFTMK